MEESGRNTGIVLEHIWVRASEAAGIAVQLSDSKLLYVSEVQTEMTLDRRCSAMAHWLQ